MFKAVCSDCGKECEVPFKPVEGRPVFCKECYMKKIGKEPRAPREEMPMPKETKAVKKVPEEEAEAESEETEEFKESEEEL